MTGRSLADLRKLQRNQLKSITKDELIDAIMSAGDADVGVVALVDVKLSAVVNELGELRRTIMSSETSMNTKLADVQDKIDKQADIIMHQQLFLESVDRKERETNLVVLGVPDEQLALDGATNDGDKIEKVWEAMGDSTEVRSHRRLGRYDPGSTRARPILVTVATKTLRDNVIEKSRKLKDRPEPYKKIYVKKDTHPAVRKEWQRLRNAETAEKERPMNQGCVIRLDTKERKLYRDGVVIDRWNPHPF